MEALIWGRGLISTQANVGTFETCQPNLKMSVHRGRPEVAGLRREQRERPGRKSSCASSQRLGFCEELLARVRPSPKSSVDIFHQPRRARLLSQSRQFLKDYSLEYSALSASSASLSRHRIRVAAFLQFGLCRSLLLTQFLDAGFEACDVLVCPWERKLTKFKGLH